MKFLKFAIFAAATKSVVAADLWNAKSTGDYKSGRVGAEQSPRLKGRGRFWGSTSSSRDSGTAAASVLDPSNDLGTWDGWGLSLAWLGNLFGEDEKLADAFFTMEENVVLAEAEGLDSLPALGLNIARYNAGGTCGGQRDDMDTYQGVSTEPCRYEGVESKWSGTTDYRRIQTFWMNWGSHDPADTTSWRWNVDLNQRQMLLNAKERNPDMIFELFSNSPPWWMLKNKDTPGNYEIGINNLQAWNEGDHAYYLSQVAKYFKDNFGIQWNAVEPFNEPQGGNHALCWWTAPKTQEGCCVDPQQQVRVIQKLREELDNADLHDVKIAASDESHIDRAIKTWERTRDDVKGLVDRLNVHGYQGNDANRQGMYDLAQEDGKQLWMSEYGDNDDWGHGSAAHGMAMIEIINRDFVTLHMTAWAYWQPMDATAGWGLIHFPYTSEGDWGQDKTKWVIHNKYYLHAQFSRHIRPGMKVIHAAGSWDDNYIVAAMTEGRLAIVLTRFAGPGDVTLDLSQFHLGSGYQITSWVTEGSDAEGRKKYEKLAVDGATVNGVTLQTTLPEWSVKTIEIEWDTDIMVTS